MFGAHEQTRLSSHDYSKAWQRRRWAVAALFEARTMADLTKTILVTGGAGFIASHVTCLLAKKYPAYKVCCATKVGEGRPIRSPLE